MVSVFSRSVFSRSAFSRSAFSRSVFSRSGFSRSVFSSHARSVSHIMTAINDSYWCSLYVYNSYFNGFSDCNIS